MPGAYFHALDEHPDGVAIYKALEVGEATQEQWNQVIGGILGIDPTDLMRRALANLHLEPRMVDAARRACAAGIKVAMLSNSFGVTPFNPYQALGMWDGQWDAIVLSEQVGVRKPDPRIYLHTLEQLQLPGEDCVFVDDHAVNLPPAEALGIRTIHHTDAAATVEQLDVLLGCATPAT
jgi:putative hydrolase of the HAD superfamily